MNLKDIAMFLYKECIIYDETYDTVMDARRGGQPVEKAIELLRKLRDKVKEDKEVYKKFVAYLHTKPFYCTIAAILDKEYNNQGTCGR